MSSQIQERAAPDDVEAVLRLVRAARPSCGPVLVVAIDGPSGSGKTTLAEAVAAELGCPLLHMDDIFPGWDGLAAATLLLRNQVLDPLARGERAAYRVWDWNTERWRPETETREVPVSDRLVVEGCGSSVTPVDRYAAVRIWVDAPEPRRLERGIARDGEAYRPHWERWAAQERELFARDGTRDRAHLVIDTGASW